MGSFLTTTNRIISYLQGHSEVQEVTFGDGNEVDLSTHTSFPLVHVIPLSSNIGEVITIYNYQILFLNTFQESIEDKIEVLDLMAGIAGDFASSLNSGILFQDQLRVSGNSGSDVIYNDRLNKLYGWSLTVNITVPSGINCV